MSPDVVLQGGHRPHFTEAPGFPERPCHLATERLPVPVCRVTRPLPHLSRQSLRPRMPSIVILNLFLSLSSVVQRLPHLCGAWEHVY